MRIVITLNGKSEIKEEDSFSPHKKVKSLFYFPNVNSIPSYLQKNKYNSTNKNKNKKSIFFPKILTTNNNTFDKDKSSKKNDDEKQKFKNNKHQNGLVTNPNNIKLKLIQINARRLNIPKSIFDEYSKEKDAQNSITTESNNYKEIKKNPTSNEMVEKSYKLRDILVPKNQKNISDSFLDKRIKLNQGDKLISYLRKDKTITRSFLEKVNKSNDKQIHKLDKICQKYFNDVKKKNHLDNEIKEKIKKEYENDSVFVEKNLNKMFKDLKNYDDIYKKLKQKKDNYEYYKNMYLLHK